MASRKFQYTILSTERKNHRNRRFYAFYNQRKDAEIAMMDLVAQYGQSHKFAVAAIRLEA